MRDKTDLKPCPLAHRGEADDQRKPPKIWRSGARIHFSVVCHCGMRGPARLTERDAVDDWNNRDENRAECDRLVGENTRLRAALANSDQPCIYCSLSAKDWAKCKIGFPGCDRADDAMGCPHLGASSELSQYRDITEELAAALNDARKTLETVSDMADKDSKLHGVFKGPIFTKMANALASATKLGIPEEKT